MTTYRYGNAWSAWDVDKEDGVVTDLFLITTNSTLRKGGQLIMGAGIAAEAVARYPAHNLPQVLGKQIANLCYVVDERTGGIIYSDYNLLISPRWEPGSLSKLGLLQTKRWPFDKSDIALVKASISALSEWLLHARVKYEREIIVHMNYPAIGYGGLALRDVSQIVDNLPDNVYVWQPPSAKPLSLPDTHDLHEIAQMSEEEFVFKFFCQKSMQALYKGPADTANGRLLQYLAMQAYEEAVDHKLPKPETSARHVSLAEFSRLRATYL
jgi:hypothetical protein